MTEPTKVTIVNPAVVKTAERINNNLKRVASSILQIGNDLIAAKKTLNHGDMELLYSQLPFSKRTGQRYMAIAKSPRLNGTVEQHELPNSVRALYAIAKMDDALYDKAIEANFITSTTTLEEIQAFTRHEVKPPVEYKEKTKAITIYVDIDETEGLNNLSAIKETLSGFGGIRIEDHDAGGKFDREQERAMKRELNAEKKEAQQIARDLMRQERQKAKAMNMSFKDYILKTRGLSPEEWKAYNPLEICYWLDCPDALNHLPLAMADYPNIFDAGDIDDYYRNS